MGIRPLEFVGTRLAPGGPPGYRRAGALLAVSAWVGLFAACLATVGFSLLLLLILYLLVGWGQGVPGWWLRTAGIFLVFVVLSGGSVTFAGRAYVAWAGRSPRAMAMMRGVSAIGLLWALAMAASALAPDPDASASSRAVGLAIASAPAAFAIWIWIQGSRPSVRSWLLQPPAGHTMPAPGRRLPVGQPQSYTCPGCRRSYSMATLPPKGTLCPSCLRRSTA